MRAPDASGFANPPIATRFWPRCRRWRTPPWESALREAREPARKHRVPVVTECILEKVTNIAMGTEIDAINEFETIECRHPQGREGLVAAGLLE